MECWWCLGQSGVLVVSRQSGVLVVPRIEWSASGA